MPEPARIYRIRTRLCTLRDVRSALVVALLVALAASPAGAHGGAIDDAIDALGAAPVYVEPGAQPTITDAQAEALADHIRKGDQPIYVAVIDPQADAPHDLVHELVDGVGRPGTYVVVAGGKFGVHSTQLPHARMDELQTDANAQPTITLGDTLNDLVGQIQDAATPAEADGDSTPWTWVVVALLAIALVAAAATVWALRRARRAPAGADRLGT
jgi:hypothetical protein